MRDRWVSGVALLVALLGCDDDDILDGELGLQDDPGVTASDAGDLRDGSTGTGEAGSSAGGSSSSSDAALEFGAPGTGVLPATDYIPRANDNAHASPGDASAAPQCPARTEQLTVSLDDENYVLNPHRTSAPDRSSQLLRDCNGFTRWDIEACDDEGRVCLKIWHDPTTSGQQGWNIRAETKIANDYPWATQVTGADLGESYWCQEDGEWRAWVDFFFSKGALQSLDSDGREMRVNMKAYIDGWSCWIED